MKHFHHQDMVKGWFVGAFSPTAHHTDACEVSVKRCTAGEKESAHYHKIATETTLVVSGTVVMFGREWNEGDIIVVEPGDITSFEAITDAVIVAVKTPGVLNDKYLA